LSISSTGSIHRPPKQPDHALAIAEGGNTASLIDHDQNPRASPSSSVIRLIEARWGGTPACARCKSTRVWTERDGFLFECADCGHQTSLTSGTVLEKTRKPLTGRDRGTARATLGKGLAVSAFPLYVPV
jgi:Zn ribbon nucleic-acid-binding protein